MPISKRRQKEIKKAKSKIKFCVACGGSGVNSKGRECRACKGNGKNNHTP